MNQGQVVGLPADGAARSEAHLERDRERSPRPLPTSQCQNTMSTDLTVGPTGATNLVVRAPAAEESPAAVPAEHSAAPVAAAPAPAPAPAPAEHSAAPAPAPRARTRAPAPAPGPSEPRPRRERKSTSLHTDGTYVSGAAALKVGAKAPAAAKAKKPLPQLLPFATMLSKLAKRKDAAAFAAPMSELWAPEELVGYYTIIKEPMDLRTVVEKLRAGDYNEGGHEAFAADARLVFKNCMTYTPSQASPYHQSAKSMMALFDRVRPKLLRSCRSHAS
jgi:hypothetical protein